MIIFFGPMNPTDDLAQALRECRCMVAALTDEAFLAQLHSDDRPEEGELEIGFPTHCPHTIVHVEWEGERMFITSHESKKLWPVKNVT